MEVPIFVTSNKNKLEEAEHILGIKLESTNLEIEEIQAVEVSKVAIRKAEDAYLVLKRPVIVEDSGVYLKCMNDFPGALIKYMLESIGTEGICDVVSLMKNDRAYAETCVAFHDGNKVHVFSGRINGQIAKKPAGNNGFGWDKVFIPEAHEITFGEMEKEEKNKLSMRMMAFSQLRDFLAK